MLTVVDMPVASLRCWQRNPRHITAPQLDLLAKSLQAEPDMLRARPLIALPNGTVVAGNQRLLAAQQLGWQTVPTVVVDLDPQRAAEWALRDNRAWGEDEQAVLDALLDELMQAGRPLDLIGYDADAVDDLLARLQQHPQAERQAFAGGYLESEEELAQRRRMGNGYGANPLRDITLIYPQAVADEFGTYVRMLKRAYNTSGVAETVFQAVERAAKAL